MRNHNFGTAKSQLSLNHSVNEPPAKARNTSRTDVEAFAVVYLCFCIGGETGGRGLQPPHFL